jgi:hypothetical protein
VSAIDYLSEDGSGTYGRWHVPHLVPTDRGVELVFVFESPHVDELRTGLPVVGAAGKSALRFPLPDPPKDLSLGRFVQQSHAARDDRIAILNVSNVPMQAAAFVDAEAPDLKESEWTLIEAVRRSRARSVSSMRGAQTRAISGVLVDGLRKRLSDVATGFEGGVVSAGTFAQRMVAAAFPDLTPLHVPHPSFNQWNRVANQNLPDLIDARLRFAPTMA